MYDKKENRHRLTNTNTGTYKQWFRMEEQPLVHDASRQHISPIKSGTSFHPLQLLGSPQPRQKKDNESLKMKVLFLSLLLGVICAAQEEEAQPSLSELSGQWRTAYIASSNLGKIKPNGPFRVYLQKLLFDDEQGTIDFYFYVKHKGKWEYKHVTGIKQDDGTFAVDYEGENVFAVTHASRNILVAHNINVDEHGKKTVLTGLFVKVNIEEEGLQKFKELTQEKGIKEKNVVNFIETDD
ncbi:odorant-binding protein-like [Ovis aries]|nr:odorant-binding protein-like [Ovis aries]XP_060264462.1 odorant-binding protein-like [Ovis aries]